MTLWICAIFGTKKEGKGIIPQIYEEENKIKYIQANHTPDYDIWTGIKGRHVKNRQILEANEMKVLRKIVGKTKME